MIIVNDMSEASIDADPARAGGAGLGPTEEKLVEMTNGRVRRALRDALLIEVRRLAAEGRFDYLAIESTGITEPPPVAATFALHEAVGASLATVAQLDTMVTVVDAASLLRHDASDDFPRDTAESLRSPSADAKPIETDFALVFIGNDLDRAGITDALDACLVPALGFAPRRWAGIPEPFPRRGSVA